MDERELLIELAQRPTIEDMQRAAAAAKAAKKSAKRAEVPAKKIAADVPSATTGASKAEVAKKGLNSPNKGIPEMRRGSGGHHATETIVGHDKKTHVVITGYVGGVDYSDLFDLHRGVYRAHALRFYLESEANYGPFAIMKAKQAIAEDPTSLEAKAYQRWLDWHEGKVEMEAIA